MTSHDSAWTAEHLLQRRVKNLRPVPKSARRQGEAEPFGYRDHALWRTLPYT